MQIAKNVGPADRLIRIVLGMALLGLWLTASVTGTLAILAVMIGLGFLGSAVFSYCPLYSVLGIRTLRRN